MFDVAPTELMLIAIVALLVIGPKDLPKAMRMVGYWVGRARGVARQFRSGFDAMVREAELSEMEKQWAEENARIMREHPTEPTPALPAATDAAVIEHAGLDTTPELPFDHGHDRPVMVEKPVVEPAPADAAPAPTPDKAAS